MSRPNEIWLSPSQLRIFTSFPGPSTFETCGRKYYFQYGEKLPRPPISNAKMGDTMHAVFERWLKADDLGLDPFSKNPIDFFPPEWDSEVTKDDATRIREILNKAETDGTIRRTPGRKVEADTKTLLCEINGYKVYMIGQIDLAEPEAPEGTFTVTDWKSSSNPDRYALSPRKTTKKYIGNDIQMNWYALWSHLTYGVDKVKVQQIYFPTKFNPGELPEKKFKEVAAILDADHMERFAEWLQNEAKRAIDLRENGKLAQPTTGACDTYGGCHFKDICNGCITVKQYRQMHERKQNQNEEGDSEMGLLNRLKKQKGEGVDGTDSTTTDEMATGQSSPEGTEQGTEQETSTPKQSTPKRGRKPSLPKRTRGSKSTSTEEPAKKTEEPKKTASKKPNLKKKSEPTPEKEPEQEKVEEQKPVRDTAKVTEDLGITVYHNCVITRMGPKDKRPVLDLQKISTAIFDLVIAIRKEEKKIGAGVQWLDLDAFDRRDLLVKMKDQILKEVGSVIVFSDGLENPDHKAVLRLLKSAATTVIQGI